MRYLSHLSVLALIATWFCSPYPVRALDLSQHPGKAIYEKMCLDCHGSQGEGSKEFDVSPLAGNRNLEALAGRIERTMPEDDPDLCVGQEAQDVAEYMYHAFYSPEARLRLNPVSKDITRLTRNQYYNSVADIMGHLRKAWNPPTYEKSGLKGHYFSSGQFRVNAEKEGADHFEREDAQIRFDFGQSHPEAPEGKQFVPEEFGVRWTGSLLVPETGVYEFVVKTRNGISLTINSHDDNLDRLIDGWVVPHNELREEKGSIFLLGGRAVPLRLQFFKFKEDKAHVELLWRKPGGLLETVPNSALVPTGSPIVYVSSAEFPADDRSYGYERGSSISRAWLDAVTTGAFDAADHVERYQNALAGVKKDDPETDAKLRALVARFPEIAFRRPLTDEEKKFFVETPLEKNKNISEAIRQTVILTLTSPRFLYPETSFDNLDSPEAKAAALALTLWDSIPAHFVTEAVQKGELNDAAGVEKMAWRMLQDSRARYKIKGFFQHWLELEGATELVKDKDRFPEFNERVLADLRTSLDLFIDEVMWSEKSDFRELLLADYIYMNANLGKVYGKPEIKGNYEKVALPGQTRSGILTHPMMMANLAYHNDTSPIHRGVFLTRNIVGMTLASPPVANEFEDSHFSPDLTMREKVTEMTKAQACMACHVTINPLGFSLERFDAIGRWRDKDRDKPIRDDSELHLDDGQKIDIKGVRDVAQFAATSPVAHQAFVRHLFNHALKQPALAYGPHTISDLEAQFRDSSYNMRHLLVKTALKATQPTPQP